MKGNENFSERDDSALKEKFQLASETLDRARASLEQDELTVETRRYLNQLFTSIVTTEKVMSW